MGYKEINYLYEYDTIMVDDNYVITKVFYQGINKSKECIPEVVSNVKQSNLYSIYIKKIGSEFGIDVDIFSVGKGTLVHYPKLNLYIYDEEDRGFKQIIQGTDKAIFVVTIKPDNKMKVNVLVDKNTIYEIEFYYHGDPMNFDIEPINVYKNGSHHIISELDSNNRVKSMTKPNGDKLHRIHEDIEFGTKYMQAIPILVVDNSILKMVDLEDSVFDTYYISEYNYRRNEIISKNIREVPWMQFCKL